MADLELLHCSERDILSGAADGLVIHLDSIHLHSRGAPIASFNREGIEPALRRRERLAVENLYSRLKVSEIKGIAITRQPIHLRACHGRLHGRDFGVDECWTGMLRQALKP